MQRSSLTQRLLNAAMVLVLTVVACNMFSTNPGSQSVVPVDTPVSAAPGETPGDVATAEPSATTPVVHTLVPGEPPSSWLSEVTDRDSSSTAAERRTLGGENFAINMFERPFNATTMDTYFPDLDIKRTRLYEDSTWVYVTIQLVGVGSGGGLSGNYGAELDLNVDGRGDLLVLASNPQAGWSTDGVRAWQDSNHDVGGQHPIASDAPVHGDGYETQIFDGGQPPYPDPDAAWARVSPADQAMVQIAFKKTLISNDGVFTFGAWADEGLVNPALYDYNDAFTLADAGSPLTELSSYYPVKALFEVDNTCRWGVGFTPTGSEPGVCPVPPTATPILPGKINVFVYNDFEANGVYGDPFDAPLSGAQIRVRSGSCGSPGSQVATGATSASGYYVASLPPGTYCVDIPVAPFGAYSTLDPHTITVTVPNGGTVSATFRYYTYLTMR